MDYILEINHLSKSYKDFKLEDINIKVPCGRIVGLVGENGAGKTTLISLILNQIKRDGGSIRIFGKDNIEKENTIKQKIGFLVDECCFHPCLTSKNIGSIMSHIYKEWDDAKFKGLLVKLNIDISKKVEKMSKGMKNKLMLAVAMAHNPSLLILDELTSGLDPIVREDILLLLKDYIQQGENTVFFSTHITSDLEKIANDIAFIHEGKLVFYESLQELQEKNILLKCSKKEYESIDKKAIISEYYNESEYSLLIKRDLVYSNYMQNGKIPTIDDIMLLYIKGGHLYDRFN